MAEALRLDSKEATNLKKDEIMDVTPEAVEEIMTLHNVELLIHGHTHRPGQYKNRIVTGAWETNGWLCRQKDQRFRLECFSLANHYESETLHPD